jgi:RND family efflux transporter MFP subunit
MKKVWFLSLLAVPIAAAFIAGAWLGWGTAVTSSAPPGRKVLYWVDPMHPAYKSDKPGIAPDCGMALEPVYADDPGGAGQPRVPGAVMLPDDKRQLIGVRVGTVESQPSTRTLRTVGRVTADDNRLYRVVAASEGLVTRLSDSTAGTLVRKQDLLLTFFNRDYLRTQQPYFLALDYLDAAAKADTAADRLSQLRGQVRTSIDELIAFGMSEVQIVELAKTRRYTPDIQIRSPVTGYVLSRTVSPEQRFDRGADLYTIADLSRVWVLVDVFEAERVEVAPGTLVRVSLPGSPSRPIDARVSRALPQFDAESRTLKIRLEVANADYALRPGMFVDAELPVSRPRAVSVPVEAVVDTGARKTVFVDRGHSVFEPRRVETGWRADDRVEIVSGLQPGERIVLSGAFMLDSESRMKAAAMGVATPVTDPVCRMEIDEAKARAAGRTVTYHGEPYFFCSDDCKTKFQADPARYVAAPAPAPSGGRPAGPGPFAGLAPLRLPGLESLPAASAPPVIWQRPPVIGGTGPLLPGDGARLDDRRTAEIAIDPACGVVVARDGAVKAGLTSQYSGTTQFFSSVRCKALFDKAPERFVVQAPAPGAVRRD